MTRGVLQSYPVRRVLMPDRRWCEGPGFFCGRTLARESMKMEVKSGAA